MMRNIRRYWRLAVWLMAMGAAVYGVESSPLPNAAQTSLTTVISIFGGLQMMINLIDNRDIVRRAEMAELGRAVLEREVAAAEREKATAERRAETFEQENAELRRRIAELEQRDKQE